MSLQERLRDLEHQTKRLKDRPSIRGAHDLADAVLELLRALVERAADGQKS